MLSPVFKKSQKEQVEERLVDLIVSSRVPVGQRLAPIKDLARRLRTSPTTVRAALAEMARKGYVELRHGSGTYVCQSFRAMTLRDSAVLCGRPHGHVWSDLMAGLTRGLSERGRMTTVFDVTRQLDAQFNRLLGSEADSFFIDGRRDFPHARLNDARAEHKHVIILVAWESVDPCPPGAHQVLSDFEAGGRCVAEHLFEAGHRRVLIAGPHDSFAVFQRGHLAHPAMPLPGFVRRFTELGGFWTAFPRHYVAEEGMHLDHDALAAQMTGDEPPTAVFGLRDIDAWLVQGTLRRVAPHLADRVELVGYYNTPWSQAGHPPITSVDIDTEAIASHALRIADSLWSGQSFDRPQVVQIQPRLIVRETSGKGPRR